jgi:hypothetical protein
MAHRLLPFRQYDENDVINLYALDADTVGAGGLKAIQPSVDDINADGVLVSVTNGNMNDNEVIDVSEDNRFMASYDSPVGRNPYPTNPLKVAPAASGDAVLGVTLNQTLAVDENGESLLFNPVKKDELQAVLSGQTVPVLTKGVVTVHANGVQGSPEVGDKLSVGSPGKFKKFAAASAAAGNMDDILGSVIATGHRGANKTGPSYGAINNDFQSGIYYVIKLSC